MSGAVEATVTEVAATGGVLLEVDDLISHYPVPRGLLGAMMRRPQLTVKAVDGVTFSVAAGEMVALVGESGCGKTTTAQTVIRMVANQGGSIRFNGAEIGELSPGALRPLRREIQIIYQDPYESLDPRFTVRDTIEEPIRVHSLVPRKEDREAKVHEAMERAGLTPPELFIDRYPHELSGGQRQRVAIAAALVLEPKLLIADEPVSMLDVSVRAQILNLFKDLQTKFGISIIFITHDLRVARYLCHRIGVMYFGKLVEIAPVEELFTAPKHPYTKALLGTVGVEGESLDGAQVAGEAFNPAADTTGCRYYARCPMRVDRCKTAHPPMETIKSGHDIACYEWRRS